VLVILVALCALIAGIRRDREVFGAPTLAALLPYHLAAAQASCDRAMPRTVLAFPVCAVVYMRFGGRNFPGVGHGEPSVWQHENQDYASRRLRCCS